MTIHLLDNVAALQAGIRGWRAVGNVRDHDPPHLAPKPKLFANIVRELANFDTSHRAMFSAALLGLTILPAGSFAQRERHVLGLAITIYLQLNGCARSHGSDLQPQLIRTFDRLAIQFFNHIASLEASLGTRTVWLDAAHQCSFFRRNMKSLGEIGSHFLDSHPDVSAHHLAMFEDLVHHVLGHIDRNGKPDPLIPARSTG